MSADGHIKIAIDVDGKQVEVASKELDNLESAGVKGGQGVKETEDALKGAGDESEKAGGKVKKFVGALGLVAIGAAAFKVLKSSLDDAITRFDTLNQFPKVLESLGVSAEDSERAMANLADGIDGLPTKLDEISSTAQRMYTSFGDMDKATDSALALNNALLGSGSSSDQARRGTEQYLKALQTGKFDMDTWNTLSETMDVGLVKIAEGFDFAGKSAKDDLYKALQDGSIPFEEFNDMLIEVGTGTGVMAELARENSLGLATSLTNLKTAVSRNLANVIESFNNLSKEVTGKEIAEHVDSLKHIINAAFTVIGNVINATIPVFKGLSTVMKPLLTIAKKLSPVIAGIAISVGVLTTGMVAARVAMLAKAAASKILGTSLKSMMGPVGWVTVGIGALAGAVTGIIKWFNKASEEEKELTEQTTALTEEVEGLNDELDQSAKQHKDNISEIDASAKANEDLMNTIQELSEKENKTAADRELLKTYTDQLNESVEGLNLSYDEQTDSLSMTNDEMADYVQYMKDQETLEESQNRLVEISKERNKAEEKLEEINKDRQEWNQHLEDGGKKGKDAKEAIENLDIAEAELMETNAELSDEYGVLQDKIEETTISINENSVAQMEQLKELLEEHQEVFDEIRAEYESLADAATDSFDRISDESKYSVDEMIKNLEHNRDMTEAWGDNIADLMEFASEEGYEGFMKHLDTMTIDQAAELQEMADSLEKWKDDGDETLGELASLYDTNAQTAMDAFNKRMGGGFEEAIGIIADFPGTSSGLLRDKTRKAGFYDIGGEITEGVVGGIAGSMPKAKLISEDLADTISETFRSALDIFSPSRVFEGYGTDITDGLGLGIGDGELNVTNAVQALFVKLKAEAKKSLDMIIKMNDTSVKAIEKSLTQLVNSTGTSMSNMLKRMKSGGTAQRAFMRKHSSDLLVPFKNIRTNFSSVGSNAMAGLNSGLWAGSGAVMASARSIANSVAGTMKSALRIHSPSRLMRDDIGKMIPEGIALGIDDNIGSVLRSLMNMNKIITGTPEMALGVSGGGAMGIGHSVVNNYLGGGGSTSATNTSNSGSTPLLKEQNTLLKALLNKQQDLYMDGEKVTKKVNEINAIEATTNLF